MQHISYELHTIIKNWTDTLSSQTKPEVVCARKDIRWISAIFCFYGFYFKCRRYFQSCQQSSYLLCGNCWPADFFTHTFAAGEKYLLIGPVMFSSFIQMNLHINLPSLAQKILLLSSAAIFIISAPMCFWPIICSVNLLLSGMISFLLIAWKRQKNLWYYV